MTAVDILVRGGDANAFESALRSNTTRWRLLDSAAQATGERDVVVIDAGTSLTPGSLDRMRRCAESDPRIGTVTPFVHGAPQARWAVERAAIPVYPDISDSSAACVLVRGDVWCRISDCEPAHYAVRARALGYRSVLCDDALVVFPGEEKTRTAADASAPIRAMVEVQLPVVRQGALPGVLHVVHALGGGTEKYVRELIAASSELCRHYFLRIYHDRFVVKPAGDDDAPGFAWPRMGEVGPAWLQEICAWLRIGVVHVHSLVGSGDDLLDALACAGVPYCYSAHDMYLPCPTVYLIDRDGDYCDATTEPEACRRCLARFTEHASVDIAAWRTRHRGFLAGAGKVYAPSRWAAYTLRKYFPEVAVAVAPPHAVRARPLGAHDALNALPLPDDGRRSIGVLGAIGPEKGARVVEAMAARIRERGLPLRIVVIGYTDRANRDQAPDGVLAIHGPYRRDEVEPLLDAYQISLVVFPTIWPETFSYTLSEAWSAGRPVLVPPRGALRERVEATGAGWLIDAWPDVDALLDQIMAVTAPESAAALSEKARLARAADDGGADDRRRAHALYRDLLAAGRPPGEPPGTRYAVYEAACRAFGLAPRTSRDRLVRPLRG